VSFKHQQWFCKLAIGITLLMTLGNAISALIECGPGQCPENPTSYKLLNGQQ